ncbi:hypothetical protein Pdw03_0360 [Penicillium digitatum]|uniref:Aflatoxin regulatory protein domain-containing protein n=1 Tax=Penicillium digitatum TaxID=36651 RepID=A0A7T6XQM4_PENDI|nr:hypothetical protein Pdw03_0360 [Penicillium digitatum]
MHHAVDQSQTPLGSKSTNQLCLTSSDGGDMTSPPSFLSDMLPNSEAEDSGPSMDISDVSSFFDPGSAAMDFSNEMPTSSATTSDNALWSDFLQTDAQSASTDLPTYPSDPQIYNHLLGGLKTPPADDDTGRDVLWTSGDAASSNFEIHTHKVIVDKSDKIRSGLLEKLSQLQHELVQSTKADTTNDGIPSRTGGSSACNNGKNHSLKHPVNLILKPGQELIDTIRNLLAKCEERVPEQTERCFDHATLVLFVITPLSLLLRTYERLLKEISSVLCSWSSHYPNGSITTASDDAPHLSHAHHQTTQQNGPFHQSHQEPPRDIHPGSYPMLLADHLSLNLGEMNLDHQTQLFVVATVINRHLIYLESALHQYQSQRIDGRVTKNISERLFNTLMSEMRASIKLLKSEARDLLCNI